MKKIGFYQTMINLIDDPCFLIFDIEGNDFYVNRQLAGFLNYKSVKEFYKKVANFWLLFYPLDRENLHYYCRHRRSITTKVFTGIRFIRPKRKPYKLMIQLQPADLLLSPTFIGVVKKTGKLKVAAIDQPLLQFFNEDKFLDEAIIIMDFKGNILNANRRLLIIDFFAALTDKRFNIIDIIDPSYRDQLIKRLDELKKGHIIPPSEYKLVTGDNKSAYIEVYSKAIIQKGRKVIVALIRDITMRKELEKRLLYSVVQTEEKERQRFAQDLHDDLGPFLSGLKMYIHELQSGTNTENREMLFDYMQKMIDEAVRKVRNIISNVTPQNMIDEGLSASVLKMIKRLSQTGKFNIDFTTEGIELSNEPSLIITLYRIILELINNSIKHSGCNNIKIRILYYKKIIKLEFADDGRGFDFDRELNNNKGIGLRSIVNRIDLYQGSYKFNPKKTKGFELIITFPAK